MMKEELAGLVGAENILDDAAMLELYSRDRSFSTPRRPSCVVKPRTTAEIQAIVRWANKTRTPLTPASSGVHFYGACIPEQGGVILDLCRMNTIFNIDRRNRCVRFEPGVTWGQLKDELKSHGLMPLTPLLPHRLKSALTSAIEREPMLIPKTEYGEPVLTMEVVLPNGDLFRTGSASVGPPGETQTDLVGPSGPGLDWYRLFQGTQGTFCVVTWINMKAAPLPKREKVFFIPLRTIASAVKPLYAILRRMIGAECFLLNRFNLACILAKKWPADFTFLRKRLAPYTLVIWLSGGTVLPRERIDYQETDLKEIAKAHKLKLADSLPGKEGVQETGVLNLLRSPWGKEPYWKERFKERCCDIFFYSTMDRVPHFAELVNRIASKKRYDADAIGFYLQPLEGGRACHLEFNIPWNGEEQERIRDLYRTLSTALARDGAFFGRPYGYWSELAFAGNGALRETLKNIKQILDPHQILNPGRLCF